MIIKESNKNKSKTFFFRIYLNNNTPEKNKTKADNI